MISLISKEEGWYGMAMGVRWRLSGGSDGRGEGGDVEEEYEGRRRERSRTECVGEMGEGRRDSIERVS